MNDTLDEFAKLNHKKRKFLLRYLFLVGITLIIIGFLYDLKYVGIPYQDPPPELLKKYNYHESISEAIINSGFIFIIIGIVGVIVRKIKRTL